MSIKDLAFTFKYFILSQYRLDISVPTTSMFHVSVTSTSKDTTQQKISYTKFQVFSELTSVSVAFLV